MQFFFSFLRNSFSKFPIIKFKAILMRKEIFTVNFMVTSVRFKAILMSFEVVSVKFEVALVKFEGI